MKQYFNLAGPAIVFALLFSSCLTPKPQIQFLPPYEGWDGNTIVNKKLVTKAGGLWVGRDSFSLVVMKKPGVLQKDFMAWVDSVIDNGNKGAIKSACASCDSSLLQLTGQGPKAIVQPESTAGGGVKSNPKLQGDTNLAFFSVNYYMYVPEIFDTVNDHLLSVSTPSPGPNSSSNYVKVGVLDTGIDPELANLYTNPVELPCMPNAILGWNMFDMSDRTLDDFIKRGRSYVKHGNPVSKFIITEAQKNSAIRPDILPVKTHDKDGLGNMWQMLCGMAYAAKSGSQIVNASCGMHAFADSQVVFIKTFIETYLTSNRIFLVAAAGNKIPGWEDSAKKAGYGLGFTQKDWRNLDSMPFYPAAFSNILENVISVTTVQRKKDPFTVSENQNFSPTRVDIGVPCDSIEGVDFYFCEPETKIYRVGSSFAAPQVAGMLAANLHRIPITPGNSINKTALLNSLATFSLIKPYSKLADKIRNGYVMLK